MPLPRPCLDCGTPTTGTRCPTHQRAVDQRRHDKQREHGRNTAYWRRLRALVLNRDEHRCQRCGRPADTVHLDPRLKGNHTLATPNHCVTLCRICHGHVDGARSSEGRA